MEVFVYEETDYTVTKHILFKSIFEDVRLETLLILISMNFLYVIILWGLKWNDLTWYSCCKKRKQRNKQTHEVNQKMNRTKRKI